MGSAQPRPAFLQPPLADSGPSPLSPYKVKVLPTHDASKVRASGPGLNTTGVPASLPVEFTIDAKDAGEGLLAVQITVGAPASRLVFLPPVAPTGPPHLYLHTPPHRTQRESPKRPTSVTTTTGPTWCPTCPT